MIRGPKIKESDSEVCEGESGQELRHICSNASERIED